MFDNLRAERRELLLLLVKQLADIAQLLVGGDVAFPLLYVLFPFFVEESGDCIHVFGVIEAFLQDFVDNFLDLEFRNSLLQSISDKGFSDFVNRCLFCILGFFPDSLGFNALIRVKLE